MGLSGDDADAYAAEVVKADLEEPGDADVMRKLLADFEAKGVGHSEHVIRTRMDQLMEGAHPAAQLITGCGAPAASGGRARRPVLLW